MFYERLRVSPYVAREWFKGKGMSVHYAMQIANEYELSLNWLLLGVGPESIASNVVDRDVSSSLRQLALAKIDGIEAGDDSAYLRADARKYFPEGRDLSSECVAELVASFMQARTIERIEAMRLDYRKRLHQGAEPIEPQVWSGSVDAIDWLVRVLGMWREENERHLKTTRG